MKRNRELAERNLEETKQMAKNNIEQIRELAKENLKEIIEMAKGNLEEAREIAKHKYVEAAQNASKMLPKCFYVAPKMPQDVPICPRCSRDASKRCSRSERSEPRSVLKTHVNTCSEA